MQYVATTRLYVLVSSLGLTARNDQIAKEAIRFYNLLIDREDEDFIEDTEFADKLNELARGISHTSGVLTIETRTELVESLFAVTAKLRQRSSIPSAWFRPRDPTQDTLSASADLPLSQHQEFLLVFILLDYVHYDGKIGDFARTGILYILESASRSPVLERWVIESEISTVLASGLGALYSQLSRLGCLLVLLVFVLIVVAKLLCSTPRIQCLKSSPSPMLQSLICLMTRSQYSPQIFKPI